MKKWHQHLPNFFKNNIQLSSALRSTPLITITGNQQIHIENKYILKSFSSEEIVLSYQNGEIKIYGEELIITTLYPEEMVLQGIIQKVLFRTSKKT